MHSSRLIIASNNVPFRLWSTDGQATTLCGLVLTLIAGHVLVVLTIPRRLVVGVSTEASLLQLQSSTLCAGLALTAASCSLSNMLVCIDNNTAFQVPDEIPLFALADNVEKELVLLTSDYLLKLTTWTCSDGRLSVPMVSSGTCPGVQSSAPDSGLHWNLRVKYIKRVIEPQ